MTPDDALAARADHDAERAVLGGCLAPGALAAVRPLLRADDFHHPAHAEVFAALCAVADAGHPLDVLALAAELRRRKRLDTVRAALDLDDLEYFGLTDLGRVAAHARTLAALADARATWRAARALGRAASDPAVTPAALRELVLRELGAVTARAAGPDQRSFADLATELYDRLEAAHAQGAVAFAGASTGFAGWDDYTGGLHPGELVVLGARPRVGKTALAMQLAVNVAARGAPVLAFSLEMSAAALFLRAAASEARVEAALLRTAAPSSDTIARMVPAVNALAGLPVYVDDRAGASLADIRAAALAMRARRGLGLLVVDYLQLLAVEERRGGTREQEVSAMSRGLKTLARELRCPVVALSQLNREVDKREDPRPRLSDLRESGSLEQDADAVVFLFRRHLYNPKADPTAAELILAKNRHGPTDSLPLRWDGPLTRFDDPGPAAPASPARPHPADPDAWSGDDDTFTSRGGDAQ